jgi:hypothetical protein
MFSIKPVPVLPFIDGEYDMLMQELRYQPDLGAKIIVVPAGFVTDFASIPRILWSIRPPQGFYQWAAVVHDFLYWEQPIPRAKADKILLLGMTDSMVGPTERTAIYEGVRTGGGPAWSNNKKERLKGLPRVIPEEYRNIPGNMTWKNYRKYLYDQGVRP